jgi:hypothetical protein
MFADRTNRNFSPLSLSARRETAMKAEIKRLQDQVLNLRVQVSRLEIQLDNSNSSSQVTKTQQRTKKITTSTPATTATSTTSTDTSTNTIPLITQSQGTQVEPNDVPRELEEDVILEVSLDNSLDDSFLSAHSFTLESTEHDSKRKSTTKASTHSPENPVKNVNKIHFEETTQAISPSSDEKKVWKQQQLVGTPSNFAPKYDDRKTNAVDSIKLSRTRLNQRAKIPLSDSTFQVKRCTGGVSFKPNEELVEHYYEEQQEQVEEHQYNEENENQDTKGNSNEWSNNTEFGKKNENWFEGGEDENVPPTVTPVAQTEPSIVAPQSETFSQSDSFSQPFSEPSLQPLSNPPAQTLPETTQPTTSSIASFDAEAYRLAGTGTSPLDALPKSVLQGMLYAYWKDRQNEQKMPMIQAGDESWNVNEETQITEEEAPNTTTAYDQYQWDYNQSEERRTDPSNGYAYTLDEFLAHYGGVDEWKVAEVWVQPQEEWSEAPQQYETAAEAVRNTYQEYSDYVVEDEHQSFADDNQFV